jgi:transcriptional antiterminator RfaH
MDKNEMWGCAHVITRQERRAVTNLRRQGFRSLYPFFIQRTTDGIMPQPLFPGYIFVLLDNTLSWSAISNTRGVIRLLTSEMGIPSRIDPVFINSLQRCLVPAPNQTQADEQLIPMGSIVRIRHGSFAGREATVVGWSRNRRLELLFSLFRRETVVEFDVRDIEVLDRGI